METNESIQNPEDLSPPVYRAAPPSSILKLKYIGIGTLILMLGFAVGIYFCRNLSNAQIP